MRVVAAVIKLDNKLLACQRAAHKSLAGFWEFPGGKVEPGETDTLALAREIREELGVEIVVGDFIVKSSSEVNGRIIEMYTYFAELVSTAPTASSDHDELRWVELGELNHLEWPVLDDPVVEALTAKI